MPYELVIATPADPDRLLGLEWIETNGTGGWASSTVAGMNTRRYHGLLVASDADDPRRICQVSRMDETLISGMEKFELGAADYGDCISPRGFQYLKGFNRDIFPEFLYEAGGITLKKTIAAIYGENMVVVHYEVAEAPQPFILRLNPFIACRDYHNLVRSNDTISKDSRFAEGLWQVSPYRQMPSIFIRFPDFQFTSSPNWYYNVNYSQETQRGLDHVEDLFSYGYFDRLCQEGDQVFITLSSGKASTDPGDAMITVEWDRRSHLIKKTRDHTEHTLRLAADQFLIRGIEQGAMVIAGYHWFTAWGRDTMISLTGLCVATGKLEEAKLILQEFIKYISQGMLPNRFPDHQTEPDYNTADASLWFFVACYNYMEAAHDRQFLKETLIPQLQDILDWHEKGTRYQIHEDEDGLLYAGEPGVQLTWMDARVDGKVITPRIGKPVEINALWYNALMIHAHFLKLTAAKAPSVKYQLKAALVRDRFRETFWNEEKKCLYDVICGNQKDDSIRPNQLLAISLPFTLLEAPQAKQVLDLVTEKLYTPRGLRSLSQDNPNYRGQYLGNQAERDGAYHQGTVWAWLLGPYIDAIMNVYGKNARKMAQEVIQSFLPHFQEAGIGTISEIFDGDAPHIPRGCIAQAWSVGELLRVYLAYKLKIGSAPSVRKKQMV
jgi:predicted glycogen debranching enzyme